MIDNQKAIEEMAKDIKLVSSPLRCSRGCDDGYHIGLEYYDKYPTDEEKAIRLLDKGYGNIRQALTAFAERLKNEISHSCAHIEIDKTATVPNYAIPENALNKAIDETLKEFLPDANLP